LLRAGADITVQWKRKTAPDIAELQGSEEVIEVFREEIEHETLNGRSHSNLSYVILEASG